MEGAAHNVRVGSARDLYGAGMLVSLSTPATHLRRVVADGVPGVPSPDQGQRLTATEVAGFDLAPGGRFCPIGDKEDLACGIEDRK
jgi:hypothetical protein